MGKGGNATVYSQDDVVWATCGSSGRWQLNNYVTASEINNAFTELNQNITNQINTAIQNQSGSAPNYSSQIQDLYTRDSTQQTQINDLYTRDASQQTQITNVALTNTNQQTQIDSLVQQFSNFNDLSARMAAAEKTITAQSATISQQSDTLSNHSTRINTSESQISALQTKTSTTDAVVGNQGQLVNSQGQLIDQQGNLVNSQGQKIDAQGNLINSQGQKIDAQGNLINTHGQKIDAQGNLINAQGQKIDAQGNLINAQGQQIDAQGNLINTQGQKIDGLETRATTTEEVVANLGTTVASQGTTLAQHENRIISNETNIAKLGTTVANQGTTLAQHENRIIANETNIANLGTTVASQGATIANHENRIIANETDIATIKDTGVTYNVGADGKKSGGLTFNDGTGKPVQLSNVAAGKATTDAVNVSQLSSAVGALGGGAQIAADGSLIGPTYAVAGKNYNNVGDALKATNEAGVQYVVDGNGKATNDIVLRGSGSGPVRMQNVANGLVSSDAANLGQVNKARQDAISYTDQRMTEISHSSNEQFSQLGGEIASTKREMRAGVSGAMAMAAMRYDNQPGKVTITGGFGSFGGMQSVSAGLGFVSQDGRWRMNAGISQNFGSDTNVGVNMGVSYTLN